MGESLGTKAESAIFEHGRQEFLAWLRPLNRQLLASANQGPKSYLPLVWAQLSVMKAQDEAAKRMETLQTMTFVGFCVSAEHPSRLPS
jgi:predicted CoA-binding protein